MRILYNGQILLEADFHLPYSNRAFQYSDGFFETLILENGKIRFWAEHLDRIREAAAVLSFDVEGDGKTLSSLPDQLLRLARLNLCSESARVKLKIWRSGAGLYTPQTDNVDWFATAHPFQTPSLAPIKIGVCETVRTIPSVFSSFKGINAPVYVLASLEKTAKDIDDLLLLDPNGNIAELTSSNIIWAKENALYTPALETGCLNGIIRRRVLAWARENQWELREGRYEFSNILEADLAFAGNVTGIRAIAQIEKEKVKIDPELLTKLRQDIFNPETWH